MSIGDGFDPHRRNQARLVVQGAVGPFDRLFEASRAEVGKCDVGGVPKPERIKRAQTLRPLAGFDRHLGLVANRVEEPSNHPGGRRIRIEHQGAVEDRCTQCHFVGENEERVGG